MKKIIIISITTKIIIMIKLSITMKIKIIKIKKKLMEIK